MGCFTIRVHHSVSNGLKIKLLCLCQIDMFPKVNKHINGYFQTLRETYELEIATHKIHPPYSINRNTTTTRVVCCSSTMVCSRRLVVRVVDLIETKKSHVRGLLESVSWPCVGAQVKDKSHVVI